MYNPQLTVFTQLIKAAKIHAKKAFGFKRPKVIEDITRKPKSFKDIMLASYVLGRYFNKGAAPQESVAIMLPNTVAAICTFFGLNAYGQVPVMLNFSAGVKNIISGLKFWLSYNTRSSMFLIKQRRMTGLSFSLLQARKALRKPLFYQIAMLFLMFGKLQHLKH